MAFYCYTRYLICLFPSHLLFTSLGHDLLGSVEDGYWDFTPGMTIYRLREIYEAIYLIYVLRRIQ